MAFAASVAPQPRAAVAQRAFWVPPGQVLTVVCLVPGLAEVRVGGRRADGADVAAGGAAGDEVSQGPLPGQGTDGTGRRVVVDKGEVQLVGAGRADGTLWAVEGEPEVSPGGAVSGAAPRRAAPAGLWHPPGLVSLTISKPFTF